MNFRLTKNRKAILDVLKESGGALSAAEIHAQLPEMDLVTVYRNLELFTKEKLIKELHLGTDEAQYEYQAKPHHHAVCTNCDRVIHFEASDQQLKKLLCVKDFKIDEVEVTVRGVCKH